MPTIIVLSVLTVLMVIAFLVLIVYLIRRNQNRYQEGQQNPLRPSQNLQPERLQLIHRSGGWGGPRREIYRDTQTGVQYLIIGTGYGASATPMLDRDGRPLIGRN